MLVYITAKAWVIFSPVLLTITFITIKIFGLSTMA